MRIIRRQTKVVFVITEPKKHVSFVTIVNVVAAIATIVGVCVSIAERM